jgi:hypothetical protein
MITIQPKLLKKSLIYRRKYCYIYTTDSSRDVILLRPYK